ncbi:MAG TPA: hypothetical protein VK808_00845 [Bacteroidia bacterium]|jgi:hypothetical protein|nr:hypothetical protein [Bacteroidia bacterium]
MKTKKTVFLLSATGLIIALSSCGHTKSITKANDEVEVILPFSGNDYQSDNENLRAVSSGHSPDLPTAQKISMQNAQGKLAGMVKTILNGAARQYTNQSSIANKQDYENKFEEQIWTFVNQTLYNVKVMGEKAFQQRKDGTFTDWVAIQESKADLLAGLSKNISSNEQLKLNYDEKKFGEDVDKEMQKMQQDQNAGK